MNDMWFYAHGVDSIMGCGVETWLSVYLIHHFQEREICTLDKYVNPNTIEL